MVLRPEEWNEFKNDYKNRCAIKFMKPRSVHGMIYVSYIYFSQMVHIVGDVRKEATEPSLTQIADTSRAGIRATANVTESVPFSFERSPIVTSSPQLSASPAPLFPPATPTVMNIERQMSQRLVKEEEEIPLAFDTANRALSQVAAKINKIGSISNMMKIREMLHSVDHYLDTLTTAEKVSLASWLLANKSRVLGYLFSDNDQENYLKDYREEWINYH